MTEVIVVRPLWRNYLLFACAGAVLGFTGSLLRGPELVSFFFKPLQDSLSCAPTVNTALDQFVHLQLACAVIGIVLALLVLFFWRRFRQRRALARQGSVVG